MTVRAVLFDYGGVLTVPVRDSVTAWLEADGIDKDSYVRALQAWMAVDAPDGTPVHRLETGELQPAEFSALLAAELRARDGGPVAAEGLLDAMFAGMQADPAMWQVVEDLRANGTALALLSNSWGNSYPRDRLEALFDVVVISGEIGLRKPHPGIYEHTLGLLDVPANEAVFVDDTEPNVEAARALGMHAVLHTDALTTRKHLSELVPGLDPVGAGNVGTTDGTTKENADD